MGLGEGSVVEVVEMRGGGRGRRRRRWIILLDGLMISSALIFFRRWKFWWEMQGRYVHTNEDHLQIGFGILLFPLTAINKLLLSNASPFLHSHDC